MSLIIVLLYLISFLLIWQFVGYPALMALVAILAKPKNKDYNYEPFVSIIISAYNEAKVIERRIINLLDLDYPKEKYEIIIIDPGSADNTYQIVKNMIEKNRNSSPTINLLRQEESRGKAAAMNLGMNHAKGNILLGTDANSVFDRNVLKEIVPHFKNPKIGAVDGRYIVSNQDNEMASSESFYWDLEHVMRRGEAALDSACTLHGSINAWRKNLVEADAETVAEDLDMAIQIRRMGYKIEYEPEAIVYERSATTPREQIVQRKRTTLGTIRCLFKHWQYFLFPRNLYTLLIFPSHKTLTMFSPFILLAIPILYIVARSSTIIIPHLIVTVLVFTLLLGILMLLKSKLVKNGRIKSGFPVFSTPKIIYYTLLNEYLILLAWKDFIAKRHSVIWTKAESTRG